MSVETAFFFASSMRRHQFSPCCQGKAGEDPTVRGAFTEGKRIYTNSGFRVTTHRNPQLAGTFPVNAAYYRHAAVTLRSLF